LERFEQQGHSSSPRFSFVCRVCIEGHAIPDTEQRPYERSSRNGICLFIPPFWTCLKKEKKNQN